MPIPNQTITVQKGHVVVVEIKKNPNLPPTVYHCHLTDTTDCSSFPVKAGPDHWASRLIGKTVGSWVIVTFPGFTGSAAEQHKGTLVEIKLPEEARDIPPPIEHGKTCGQLMEQCT